MGRTGGRHPALSAPGSATTAGPRRGLCRFRTQQAAAAVLVAAARAGAAGQLARYAGHYYGDRTSVRQGSLYPRYAGQLTDGNITHYLLTHPASILGVGQSAAILAQRFRITWLGDYPVSAGHPKSACESPVVVLTWLMHQLPPGLGLWWLIPLWLVMAAVAVVALGWGRAWHRDGAVVVLCMIQQAGTGAGGGPPPPRPAPAAEAAVSPGSRR